VALYNEILVGRINRFFQKYLQMKGNAPAPQLAGEVQPSLSLFTGSENRYLEGWNLFASGVQAPAVAGQVTDWQIRNPPGSNVVAIIEKLIFQKAVIDAAPFFTIVSQDTNKIGGGYAGAVGVRCLDSRPVKGSTSTLGATLGVSIGNNIAATGGVIGAFSLQAFVPISFIQTEAQEIPLLPGDSLLVTTGDAGILYVSVDWRERFLEESERT